LKVARRAGFSNLPTFQPSKLQLVKKNRRLQSKKCKTTGIQKLGGNPRELGQKLSLDLTSSSKATLMLSTSYLSALPERFPKNFYQSPGAFSGGTNSKTAIGVSPQLLVKSEPAPA
jgi:hypothetical protein